jgi:Nif-specific regulatory protein
MNRKNQSPLIKSEIHELTLLFEISQILDKSLDLRDIVGPVLKSLSKHSGMVRGTITLLDRETGEIAIDAAQGLTPSQLVKGRYKFGEGVTGMVAKTGRPVVVPHISENPLFLDRTGARASLKKEDISFICVPILIENEVIGTLSADRLFENSDSLDEDVRILSIVASMISKAVHLRQAMLEERKKLVEENTRLQEELKIKFRPSNIIGNSKVMRVVYDQIAKVSNSIATALILGESGTGKELVAQAIHYNSPRSSKPFIKVNCAALPESLIESELFGHEKGAFTGALALRKGRFELAEGGTLLLDEIGDLSQATQVKLLRFLQEREFERLGGTKTIKSDVRIIAATHKNLEELVSEGIFRQDLYYRLNVFPIFMPPLRERPTDIPLLADFFVEKYNATNFKDINRISTPAIDMLMSYHWPGNVRELENCIERAVLISDDHVIHSHHLPPTLQTAEASATKFEGTLQSALDKVEKDYILDALKSSRGNMVKASQALGITERIMGLRIKRFGIDSRRFRTIR